MGGCEVRFRFWLFLYRIAYWLLIKAMPGAADYEFVVGKTRYIDHELKWTWEHGKIVGRITPKPS